MKRKSRERVGRRLMRDGGFGTLLPFSRRRKARWVDREEDDDGDDDGFTPWRIVGKGLFLRPHGEERAREGRAYTAQQRDSLPAQQVACVQWGITGMWQWVIGFGPSTCSLITNVPFPSPNRRFSAVWAEVKPSWVAPNEMSCLLPLMEEESFVRKLGLRFQIMR